MIYVIDNDPSPTVSPVLQLCGSKAFLIPVHPGPSLQCPRSEDPGRTGNRVLLTNQLEERFWKLPHEKR